MNNISFIIVLLLTHFISDFLLQRRDVAISKSSKLLPLLEHFIIIYASLTILGLFYNISNIVNLSIIYSLIHIIQDKFIWSLYKYKKPKDFKYWEDSSFYNTIALDQFLHISFLIYIFKEYI